MKTYKHLHNDPVLCDLNRVELDGKRYYLSPNGKKLPSVTTFLSHFKKQQIYRWRKRVGDAEANRVSGIASRRGTQFHSLMESCLTNQDPALYLKDITPDLRQSFNDVVPTLDRIDNIHYIETPLFSETIGLAGQVDCIAEFDGVPSIIDWKTSTKVKKEDWVLDYFLQTTAYSLMYEDMTGVQAKQLVVVISVDHEYPQVFVKQRGDYVKLLYDRLKEYRQLT